MKRLRKVVGWGLVVVLGLVLGLGSAAWVLFGRSWGSGAEQVGAWLINTEVGGQDGGPYVRGVTATQGLLALNKAEAVYFVANTDDEGRALDGTCTYELTGADFPATWWSITSYDGVWLTENDDASPSVDATSVERADDGTWTARLSPTEADATNWISTAGNESSNLVLRLYMPEESMLDDPSIVEVPTITRTTCEESA